VQESIKESLSRRSCNFVKGTYPASKKEIPKACEAMGFKVLDIEDKEGGKEWEIKIQR
jgi:tRNA 2-thiouridine synthesizing protein A